MLDSRAIMAKNYIVKEIDGRLFYDEAMEIRPNSLRAIDHSTRIRILNLLNKKPMYPVEIAKALRMHEQKVYYHVKQMLAAGVLRTVEKKEIRGTTAKKLAPTGMNFNLCLNFSGKSISGIQKENRPDRLDDFLRPFIMNGRLNTRIVVGSPDPHGPFKARARDGHYAIELALFLGSLCSLPKGFSTSLDVDVDLKKNDENLIIVGGPVTNLTMAGANDFLPARFSDKKPWGIAGKESYTDDNIGLLAKIPHPFFEGRSILAVAGIRYSGTMSAVIALSRYSSLMLSRYTGQNKFYSVVEGFDMDGDGRVDSVEVLE